MDCDDDFLPGTPQREISIRRRVRRLAEFYRHLMVFLTVISLIWLLNAWQFYNRTQVIHWYSWWALWPTLGWGIGVFFHGLAVLPVWNFLSQDWEDRKVKELLERGRK